MKKIVLAVSGLVATAATALAIYAAVSIGPNSKELDLLKRNMVAGYLGLLSVSLFFVGLATPRE